MALKYVLVETRYDFEIRRAQVNSDDTITFIETNPVRLDFPDEEMLKKALDILNDALRYEPIKVKD